MAKKPTFASVIKNPGFRYLWFNQILVQLAYNTLNFALLIWVFKLIGNNSAVSALMMAIYLPVIFFGVFAGVFVDILDRRKIILLIDIVLALTFLLFIFVKASLPLILIVTFFINSLAQFFMPSESSSIPMLVTKKQLFLANSLFSLTLYGAFMVGFTIGGPILNYLGINAVFYLGTFMLLFAFLLAQRLPQIKAPSASKKLDRSLSFKNFQKMITLTIREGKDTVEFARGKMRVAVAIGLMSAIQGVIGVLAVIMSAYLEKVLLIHATDSSYFLMLPLGLGMVLGALMVGKLFHNRPKRSLVIPAILGVGILFLLAGAVPTIAQLFQSSDLPIYLSRPRYFFLVPSLSFWFALGAFLTGICAVSIIIPCQTVLQESTTEKNRGKIFAVLAVVMTSFAAIPVILAGKVADTFGVLPLVTGIGLIAFLVGLLALRPSLFFKENHLPFKIRQFLGLGHWEKVEGDVS